MRILSIDTTAHFGSLAILDDERIVEEILLHAPDGFGQILFDQISRLLAKQNWKISEIDRFAAAAGPGSFTGVRIGLTAAKGLAEATGKPAIAVSNLEALAELGTRPLRATLLDARRGEIYGAVYDAQLNPICPEIVTPFRFWLDSLPEGDLEFITTDFAPFRTFLQASFQDKPVIEQRNLAGAIGKIAARKPATNPAAIDANYVRRSDAELLWKE
jgi:tRNA threonylcarbamoyladenosine biosynthesis protein TsaB